MDSYEQRRAVLDAMLAVAWADGSYDARERRLMEEIAASMGYAAVPPTDERGERRTLAELLTDEREREQVYALAVRMSWSDGTISPREQDILDSLRRNLQIAPERARALREEGRG